VQVRIAFELSQQVGFFGQVSVPISIAWEAKDTIAAWAGANSRPILISTAIRMRQVCHSIEKFIASG
jgi:hypothetical protein